MNDSQDPEAARAARQAGAQAAVQHFAGHFRRQDPRAPLGLLDDLAAQVAMPSREELEQAIKALWGIGLHPRVFGQLTEAAAAARKMVERLRQDIATPPNDVCEMILQRAGYYEMWAKLSEYEQRD